MAAQASSDFLNRGPGPDQGFYFGAVAANMPLRAIWAEEKTFPVFAWGRFSQQGVIK
jgi:hypothetical protein